MPIPPPREHRIPIEQAAAMTRRYRETMGKDDIKASMYPVSVYDDLKAQPGCAYIRIYFARHEDGRLDTVLCGVNKDGYDMVPRLPATTAAIGSASADGGGEEGGEEGGDTMNNSYPCPFVCDPNGPPLDGP